jgi:penicillin G amidase
VVRTPTSELGDAGLAALLPLLRARTVADVDAALDLWVEPVNNVLVADTSGRVLHRVAGRMPARDGGAWAGWVDLPRIDVRPGEVAVTANDRTDERWDLLAGRFAAPWRRDRIAVLLDRDGIDVTTAAAVLTDDHNAAAGSLLSLLLGLGELPGPSRLLADQLRDWEGSMSADSTAAGAFAAVRDAIVAAVVAHPLLAPARLAAPPVHGEVLAPWWHLPTRVARVLPDLVRDPPPGLDLDELARSALAQVAALPTQPWGERHRFTPVHAFADLGPAGGLDPAPYLPGVAGSPLGGDIECVAAASWIPGTDMSVSGPIARLVWDLSDRSLSRWAVPLGASGVVGDRAHDNQFASWKDGTLIPVSPALAFSLRPVDPPTDAPLLHGWFTRPRAAFWGMGSRSVEEVADIYGWIAEQEHLTASLVLLDEHPIGLVQTYDPLVDEIGRHYDRREGDLGVHLFLADDEARAGTTSQLMAYLVAHVFADPAVERIVLEPDIDNAKSVALLLRLGAELGPVTEVPAPMPDLPAKRAQFAFFARPLAAVTPG